MYVVLLKPLLYHIIYFITFIDDYSRNNWVYILKHRSETFDVFKKSKALIENEYGKSIKTLRIDNVGAFH